MQESPFVRKPLNDAERGQLVRKAKADRIAFDAAQLLSLGDTAKAATLAGEGVTLLGAEHLTDRLRHYATARFKVARVTVDSFLGTIQPA